MAANIEIKARLRDWDAVRAAAEKLSDTPGTVMSQEDTFFCVPRGRLKLRVLGPCQGQLIYYERVDTPGPKRSDYLVLPTTDPSTLRAMLALCLGVRGVVRKRRTLYVIGSTRVHLDEVEGLGAFAELEVMLGPDQSVQEGEAIAAELMRKLDIREFDLVEGAYIDLLESMAREAP